MVGQLPDTFCAGSLVEDPSQKTGCNYLIPASNLPIRHTKLVDTVIVYLTVLGTWYIAKYGVLVGLRFGWFFLRKPPISSQ